MIAERVKGLLLRRRAGRIAYSMAVSLDHHHAPIAASAMAFDAFLSLVPVTALAGFALQRLHESGSLVLRPLMHAAPHPVAALVEEAFELLSSQGAAVVAPVSIAAFWWTSSAGVSTAMSVFESVFHRPPRPFWLRRLIALLFVFGGIAALALLTAVAFVLPKLAGAIVGSALAYAVPALALAALLAAFFLIAVHGPRPARRRSVLPGVVATLALWTLSSALFSYYVTSLSRYSTLYGGLAAVAIFLFWLWLLALAVLVGGEVNAHLEGIREGLPEPGSSRPPEAGAPAPPA